MRNTRLFAGFCVLLLMPILSYAGQGNEYNRNVKVKVLDGQGSNPIEGAKVFVVFRGCGSGVVLGDGYTDTRGEIKVSKKTYSYNSGEGIGIEVSAGGYKDKCQEGSIVGNDLSVNTVFMDRK